MSKYVRDKAHCKHESYSKIELDELFLNKVYPIGSIYIGINETNPSTLFGGEWEQIKDTFLLSAGDKYEAGSIGGEAEHTLTIEEMPSHRHNIFHKSEGTERLYTFMPDGNTGKVESIINTSSEGGNKPHNNMPPYLTVYMWKRTA